MKFLQHLHAQGCAPRLAPSLLDDCHRDGPFAWGIQIVGVEKNVCIQKTISGHEAPLGSVDERLSGNLHGAEPTPRQAGQEPLHFEEPSQALESPNFSSRFGDAQLPPSFAPKSHQEVQWSFSYAHKYGTISVVSSGKGYQRPLALLAILRGFVDDFWDWGGNLARQRLSKPIGRDGSPRPPTPCKGKWRGKLKNAARESFPPVQSWPLDANGRLPP